MPEFYDNMIEGPTVRRDPENKTFSVTFKNLDCIRGKFHDRDRREETVNFVKDGFNLFLGELDDRYPE